MSRQRTTQIMPPKSSSTNRPTRSFAGSDLADNSGMSSERRLRPTKARKMRSPFPAFAMELPSASCATVVLLDMSKIPRNTERNKAAEQNKDDTYCTNIGRVHMPAADTLTGTILTEHRCKPPSSRVLSKQKRSKIDKRSCDKADPCVRQQIEKYERGHQILSPERSTRR